MATKARGIYMANGGPIKDFYAGILPNVKEETLRTVALEYVNGVRAIMQRPMRAKLAKHARTGETVAFFDKTYREGAAYLTSTGRVIGGLGFSRYDDGAITRETMRRKGSVGGAVGDGPFYRALYQEMGNGGRPGGKFPDEWFEKNIRGTATKRHVLLKSLFDKHMK